MTALASPLAFESMSASAATAGGRTKLDLADLFALCDANADVESTGTSLVVVPDGTLEPVFAGAGGGIELAFVENPGVVVNLGTTLIGTFTACDLLRAGRFVVFELVLLEVNSVKVLIS